MISDPILDPLVARLSPVNGVVAVVLGGSRARGRLAKTKVLPRVENVFVVSEKHVDFVIDYVPQGKASCRTPGSEGDAVS